MTGLLARIRARVGAGGASSAEAARAARLLEAITSQPRLDAPAHAGVVFSMDRAMQLEALLASWFALVEEPPPLHVLYRTSSEGHARAYRELLDEYGGRLGSATAQEPGGFREELARIVSETDADRTFFLADDDVFKRPLCFGDLDGWDPTYHVVSLRLGTHLERAYTLQRPQPLPPFLGPPVRGMLAWRWRAGSSDWRYPLSVDGHVFNTAEIRVMIDELEFAAPNSFEGEMNARYAPLFLDRLGVCFEESILVNLPINKVQTENENIHGDVHQDRLLEMWNEGLRIDWASFRGVRNRSAHEELPVRFVHRAERDSGGHASPGSR